MFDRPATMSEAAREFAANTSDRDPSACACHGNGWILSPFDSWEKCPAHFKGQRHPEDFDCPEDTAMVEVQVLGTNTNEPYTRSGNVAWLAAFVVSILEEDPGAQITINP